MTIKEEICDRQRKALPRILAAPTITEGCKRAKVSRNTFYSWLKEPPFKSEYDKQGRELVEVALRDLQATVPDAVATLRKLLKSGQHAVKFRAAQLIIENVLKRIEIEDIGSRLAALEETVKQREQIHGQRF